MAVFLIFVFITNGISESEKQEYINKWRELVCVESQRSGIPASIILGQAILESSYGRSPLATNANNHFGIKCKRYWTGKVYHMKDDDRNAAGHLISSCFRAYDQGTDSFVDHSHFLMNSLCYRSLQDFDKEDYKSWAKGLFECGYATDQSYPKKLIRCIEVHRLWEMDTGQ